MTPHKGSHCNLTVGGLEVTARSWHLSPPAPATEEDAFRAALAPDPRNDTARLAYADWLDERGRAVDAALQRVLALPWDDGRRLEYAAACEAAGEGERGEFIRVQCELEPLRDHGHGPNNPHGGRDCPTCVRVAWLEHRERELAASDVIEKAFAAATPDGFVWATESFGKIRDEIAHLVVRRGFVAELTCTAADWETHGDAIRESQPVERVRLTTMPEVEVSQDGPQTWLAAVRHPGGTMHYVLPIDMPPAQAARRACEMFARWRWPGVEVTLPPEPEWGESPLAGSLSLVELQEQMLQHLIQSFGLPASLVTPPG